MNEILIKASQFIASLSLLIVLHELGHFIPAKLFKTRVEKFFLFFDVKFALFKKKIGETVYGIGWLPLGGYVKIAGMIDESMDTEQLQKEPEEWEFRSKPTWQRLIIMLGGVTVNFLLGVLIYIGLLFAYGEKYLPNENIADGLWVRDSLGYELGLKNGDKILQIDGEKVKSFNMLPTLIINGNSLTIERNEQVFTKEIPVDFISKLIENKKNGFFLYPRIPLIVERVVEDSPNQNSGLQSGDQIIAINGEAVKYADEAMDLLNLNKGKQIDLTVKREDSQNTLKAVVNEKGQLGVFHGLLSLSDLDKLGFYDLETKEYSFIQAIPAGIKKTYTTLRNYLKQLKKIFNPETGAYKGLGGFIAIGSIFTPEWDWQAFWGITAFLSIMLGVLNLLPIPALDGGHVMFLVYEMITGRKPHDKVLEYAQIVGFIFLLILVIYANGNDIAKLFGG